jgi:hypothetical protein
LKVRNGYLAIFCRLLGRKKKVNTQEGKNEKDFHANYFGGRQN